MLLLSISPPHFIMRLYAFIFCTAVTVDQNVNVKNQIVIIKSIKYAI